MALSLVHFSRFPQFIPMFIKTIRMLILPFTIMSVFFVVGIMFVRGRELIVRSWVEYALELLRYWLISLMLAMVLLTISGLFGALFGLVAKELGGAPTVNSLLYKLRQWVDKSFY
nr:hypothetical protein 4 [bacterium]